MSNSAMPDRAVDLEQLAAECADAGHAGLAGWFAGQAEKHGRRRQVPDRAVELSRENVEMMRAEAHRERMTLERTLLTRGPVPDDASEAIADRGAIMHMCNTIERITTFIDVCDRWLSEMPDA